MATKTVNKVPTTPATPGRKIIQRRVPVKAAATVKSNAPNSSPTKGKPAVKAAAAKKEAIEKNEAPVSAIQENVVKNPKVPITIDEDLQALCDEVVDLCELDPTNQSNQNNDEGSTNNGQEEEKNDNSVAATSDDKKVDSEPKKTASNANVNKPTVKSSTAGPKPKSANVKEEFTRAQRRRIQAMVGKGVPLEKAKRIEKKAYEEAMKGKTERRKLGKRNERILPVNAYKGSSSVRNLNSRIPNTLMKHFRRLVDSGIDPQRARQLLNECISGCRSESLVEQVTEIIKQNLLSVAANNRNIAPQVKAPKNVNALPSNINSARGPSKAPVAKNQVTTKTQQNQEPSIPCKIAIAVRPNLNVQLTLDQLRAIRQSILSELDRAVGINATLGFIDCAAKNGYLVLTCINEQTKRWLKKVIEKLPRFPPRSLKIFDEDELIRNLCCMEFSPDDIAPIPQILHRLQNQNAGLSTANWKVVRTLSTSNNGGIAIFSIDGASTKKIREQGGKLFFNFSQIEVKIKEENELEESNRGNNDMQDMGGNQNQVNDGPGYGQLSNNSNSTYYPQNNPPSFNAPNNFPSNIAMDNTNYRSNSNWDGNNASNIWQQQQQPSSSYPGNMNNSGPWNYSNNYSSMPQNSNMQQPGPYQNNSSFRNGQMINDYRRR